MGPGLGLLRLPLVRHPAATGQRIIERGALHAKGPTHRRFAHATGEGRRDRGPLLRPHGPGSAARFPSSLGGREASPDPLLGQGAFILGSLNL